MYLSYNPPFISGLKFWKCASRKLYAVARKHELRTNSRSYNSMDITDDSDEEFIPQKRRDCKNGYNPLVISGKTEIKSMVSDILQVNEMMSLRIGVVKLVRDAFMCKICRVTPMDPPPPPPPSPPPHNSHKMLQQPHWLWGLCQCMVWWSWRLEQEVPTLKWAPGVCQYFPIQRDGWVPRWHEESH